MTGSIDNNDEIEIDLREIGGLILSKLGLIISVSLFFALLMFLVSNFLILPTYESTTKIYILNKQEDSAVTYSDVQMGTQLTKDYAELITSRYVLEEVNMQLGLNNAYDNLLKKVKVTTPSDTRILAITVSDQSPIQAMNIANTVREVSAAHIENVMDIEAVNIVETANLPEVKASPSILKWSIAGGIIACFVVCAVILIMYILNDTIKTSDDVERYLQLSTLALIPMGEDEKKRKRKRKK